VEVGQYSPTINTSADEEGGGEGLAGYVCDDDCTPLQCAAGARARALALSFLGRMEVGEQRRSRRRSSQYYLLLYCTCTSYLH
jgi:hypothetical protein